MVDANEIPSPEDSEGVPPITYGATRQESIKISNISDQAAEVDLLGFTPYVEAIAEFLSNDATRPPLTLSIEGDWGSGKSSFMRQLRSKLEQIEKQKHEPISRKVWFNAWRHDKVEALWAAFALNFLEQISQPQIEIHPFNPRTWRQIFNPKKWEEFGKMQIGALKLFCLRFNWQENKLEALRVASLGAFFALLAACLPILFLSSGTSGINLLSDRVLCRLSASEEPESASAPVPSLAEPVESEPASAPATSSVAPPVDIEPNCLTGFPYLLLWLGGLGGTTTGALALLVKAGEIMGDPKNDLKQYLESPDYENKVAFIEKFHEDFEKIVSAYVGEGNKVYVFVDDLDRCELTKAADLMQGLNLLISNDPNLIFILGMDREKVAAGIALKHKDVLPYLSSPAVVLNQAKLEDQTNLKGLEYGYAFIEKFVQLPFQLPRPSQQNFEDFLVTLPSSSNAINKYEKSRRRPWFDYWPWLSKTIQRRFQINYWSRRSKTTQQSPKERIQIRLNHSDESLKMILQSMRDPLEALNLDELQSNSTLSSKTLFDNRKTLKLRFAKDSIQVQNIVLKVAPALDYNPRRIKQFINLFRLKAFIASNTGLFDELIMLEPGALQPEDAATGVDHLESNSEASTGTVTAPLTLEQLGIFTALCMKYPLLKVDLVTHPELLQSLHQYATDQKAWHATVETKEISIREATEYWGSHGPLMLLLQVGFSSETVKPPSSSAPSNSSRFSHDDLHSYDLRNVDANKLLQVSPPMQTIDRVKLKSERGVDYRKLRALLRIKAWKAADLETVNILLQLAQQEGNGYVSAEEFMVYVAKSNKNLPNQDLQTIDQIWEKASNGRVRFLERSMSWMRLGMGLLQIKQSQSQSQSISFR